jgi:hypothetical protein
MSARFPTDSLALAIVGNESATLKPTATRKAVLRPEPKNLSSALRGYSSWQDIQRTWGKLPEKQKGDLFEELVKDYFQLEPEYASKLKHVWLQREVPQAIARKLKLPATDQGIDIVAETHDGDFWAIQCKYRQSTDQAGYTDAEIDALEKETAFYAEIRAAIKKHSGEELDIKPYEADMRHLINTYIQADPATDLGNLSSLSLTQLIIETGIHDAIAKKLNQKGKLSKNAIAEGIINNVRKTIIRDQLTDPRFYAEMSKLLDDLIKQARTDAADYEKFLQKAEELVRKLVAKTPSDDVPAVLHGNKEATVIFNNLPTILANPTSPMLGDDDEVQLQKRTTLALEIDRAMREMAPAGWKEDIDGPRGRQVLNALFPLLGRDRDATRALFEIIKNQPGY